MHGCRTQGKCHGFAAKLARQVTEMKPARPARYFFSLMALTQDASSTSKTLLTFLHPVRHAAIQSCCLHQEICSIPELKG